MTRRLVEAAGVLLLLGALAGQLARGLASDGLTNDEVLFIPAGYRQIALGDYRLNPTHPPLATTLSALGLAGLDLRIPPLPEGGDVLGWCYRFIHVVNDPGPLIQRARLPTLGLTLALAFLVWLWGRSVAGPVAAFAALFAVAFHPSIVAHGHLATTDVAGAFAGLLATWCFWRWLERPGLDRAALFAVVVGLGAATRHTTLVALPVFALATAWALFVRKRREGGSLVSPAGGIPLRALAALIASLVVLVPAAIWAAYGFHDAPWAADLARPPKVSAGVERVLSAVESSHVVPAGFVGSVRFQWEHTRHGHPGYLLGEQRMRGWWYYDLVALAVKNTPGFLLAMLSLPWIALRVRRAERHGRGSAILFSASSAAARALWVAVGLAFFASASLATIQIGERYLLPFYPFACLLLGALVPAVASTRRGVFLLAALAALHALPTLAAVGGGGTISYFNLLAGGRDGGHRVLLDSNLDWGQDLPRLAAWMRHEGVRSVQLAYQGADDPARYGIAWEDLPAVHLYPPRPAGRPFEGVVVVSPNHLLGLPPKIGDTYAALRSRPPDARAGVFFVYRMTREPEPDRRASVRTSADETR